MNTLDELKASCDVDALTDCWHYKGATLRGIPRIHLKGFGKSRVVNGRRAAFCLSRGYEPPSSHRIYQTACCKSRDCVNPDHCKAASYDQYAADMAKFGAWKNCPSKVRASRNNARVAQGKLTLEIARQIRTSDEPAREAATRYGVHHRRIQDIRNGKAWKENTIPGADVFSWAHAIKEAA